MRAKIKYSLGGVAFVAAIGIFANAMWVDRTARGSAFVFETAPVTKGDILKVVSTTGTVSPRVTVQVGSEISGRVKSIAADFNAKVNAGDLLAVIDPKTFDSKAKQARADLLSAEAAIVSAEAAVRKSRSVLTNAERAFQRQRSLDQKGIAAGAQVDNSERDLHVARAEVEVAQANLQNASAGVAQKQALLDQAMIDLERTRIRAPISGIVLHRSVDVGQTVAANFQAPELFRLAGDLTSIHIEAQVGEADIGSVRKGQPVSFDVDAHPKKIFKGRVEQVRLSPASTDSVVTYTVIIEADNSKLDLFPGMTANVRIETARREAVVRISTDAIRFKPPKSVRSNRVSDSSAWARGTAWFEALVGSGKQPVDTRTAANAEEPADAAIHRWARRLKLDDAQVEALKGKLQFGRANQGEVGAASWSWKSAGTRVPSKTPEEEASPFEVALSSVLTPDQKRKLEAYRTERESTQRATVWVVAPSGQPERRSIRVGLMAVKHVELASKELQPGDEVIVRSRKVKSQ